MSFPTVRTHLFERGYRQPPHCTGVLRRTHVDGVSTRSRPGSRVSRALTSCSGVRPGLCISSVAALQHQKGEEQRSTVDRREAGSILTEETADLSRRRAFLSTAAVLLSGASGLSGAAADVASSSTSATAAPVVLDATFTVPEAGFSFDYPSSWITAIKRKPKDGALSETLAFAGDFRAVDTVSVARAKPAVAASAAVRNDASGPPAGEVVSELLSTGTPQQIAEELTADVASNANTMRFALERSEAAGGGVAEYEFTMETCRGAKTEGAGGKEYCVSPQDESMTLQTIQRRFVVRAELRGEDGYLYQVTGSAKQERWAEVGPQITAVVRSFRFAS